jgi:SAM-dependent methyltransferase
MDPSLEQLLRCPLHPDDGVLTLTSESAAGTEDPSECVGLTCRRCGRRYPVRDGVPALIPDDRPDPFRDAEMSQSDSQADQYDLRRLGDLVYRAGVEAAAEALACRDGDLVLDAGCGTGQTVRAYARPGLRVVALDLSPSCLRRLRDSCGSASVFYAQGDVRRLPFASDAFDRVLCANTVTQLADARDRAASLRELARVARPGGRVVVTAHNLSVWKRRKGLTREGSGKAYGLPYRYVYRFEPAEFREFLTAALGVESVRGAGLPLPYRLKLGRLSQRLERLLRRRETSANWGNMLVGIGHKAGNPGRPAGGR